MIALVVLTPTAATVTAQVQDYYKKVDHLSGEFTQKNSDKTFGRTTESKGTVVAVKPNKVKFGYGTKKTYVTDGKTFWAVDTMNKRVYTGPLKSDDRTNVLTFVTNDHLDKDFTITLSGDHTLELVPKVKDARVAKLVLVVDTSDGHVSEAIVTNEAGDTQDMTWKIDTKSKVDDKQFALDPAKELPDYEVKKQ